MLTNCALTSSSTVIVLKLSTNGGVNGDAVHQGRRKSPAQVTDVRAVVTAANTPHHRFLIIEDGAVDVVTPSLHMQDVEMVRYVPQEVDVTRTLLRHLLRQLRVHIRLERYEHEGTNHRVTND